MPQTTIQLRKDNKMINTIYTLNVDSMIVTNTLITINLGDHLRVTADWIKDPKAEPGDCAPISWSLGESPEGGKGFNCLDIIAEDDFAGIWTFCAVGYGTGYIKYDITSGPAFGRSKTINFKVI